MNAAISALIWCAVQVTALTTVVALIYLAARRVHPRAGAAAAGGGLLMVVAITLLVASPWPRWNLTELGSRANWYSARNVAHATATTSPTGNNGSESQLAHEPVAGNIALDASHTTKEPSYWQAFLEVLNKPSITESTNEMDAAAKPQAMGWAMIVVGVLLTGGMVAAARLIWSILDVRRLARSGHEIHDLEIVTIARGMAERLTLPCPVTLRESAELTTPATVGWRKPVMLLPATWREWSHAELRAVVAHELAHIAGRDYAAWFVARLAVVVHFYHPLVRWLASRLQLEQELAADMTAARLVGDSKQYLHSLASLALAMPPTHMAGPARTLFPSRSLLMRRVEMLRGIGVNHPRRGAARYATFAGVALVAFAAAGLRGPGIDLARTVAAESTTINKQPTEATTATNGKRFGAELIPSDAAYVIYLPVARLMDDKRTKKMLSPWEFFMFGSVNDNGNAIEFIDTVEEVMMAGPQEFAQSGNHRWILRSRNSDQVQHFLEYWRKGAKAKLAVVDGQEMEIALEGETCMRLLDARTIVIDSVEGAVVDGEWKGEIPPLTYEQPEWHEEWGRRVDTGFAVGAINFEKAFPNAAAEAWKTPEDMTGFISLMTLPIRQSARWGIIDLDFNDHLQLNGAFESENEESAIKVRDALRVLISNTQSVLVQYMAAINQTPVTDDVAKVWLAVYRDAAKILDQMLSDAKVETKGQWTHATLQSKVSTDDIFKLVDSGSLMLKEGEQNSLRVANLRDLALALLNYEDTYRQFPAAASHLHRVKIGDQIKTDVKSKYPHSWRVALLPFLDQQRLYDQYRFDEPWDSEANKKVLEQMPDVYRSPNDAPESTNTSYFVFTGPETVFPPDTATKVSQITDGTSRTISMVELKRAVPWTKPEDVEYASDKPMPKLETWTPGKLIAAFVDGHVDTLALDMDEKTLRDFITKGSFGGEGLNPGGEFENPTTVPAPSKP